MKYKINVNILSLNNLINDKVNIGIKSTIFYLNTAYCQTCYYRSLFARTFLRVGFFSSEEKYLYIPGFAGILGGLDSLAEVDFLTLVPVGLFLSIQCAWVILLIEL